MTIHVCLLHHIIISSVHTTYYLLRLWDWTRKINGESVCWRCRNYSCTNEKPNIQIKNSNDFFFTIAFGPSNIYVLFVVVRISHIKSHCKQKMVKHTHNCRTTKSIESQSAYIGIVIKTVSGLAIANSKNVKWKRPLCDCCSMVGWLNNTYYTSGIVNFLVVVVVFRLLLLLNLFLLYILWCLCKGLYVRIRFYMLPFSKQ